MSLFLAGTLLLTASLLFAAILAPPGAPARMLAIWLLACGQVVLLSEVLSEGGLLGARGFVAGHAVLLALAIAAWRLAGRPRVLFMSGVEWRRAASFAAAYPFLSLFSVGVMTLTATNVAWAFLYPQLDGDANAYHLPRALYWVTLGTARHFPTSDYRLTQMPPNASFLYGWFLAFTRTFTGLHVPQAAAGLALAAAVAGLARLAGAAAPAALFAAAASLTFPVAVFQMGTCQTDLTVAAFGVTATFFGLSALRGRPEEVTRNAACFGLAVGLALGTKLTMLFLLPGLGVGLLLLGRALARREVVPRLGALLVSAVAGFLLFGAYNYVLNALESGNPIAAREGFAHFYGDRPEASLDRAESALRYARLLVLAAPAGESPGFGPLGGVLGLLAIPVAVASLVSWRARREPEALVRAVLVVIGLSFPAAYIALRPPLFIEGARYFLLAVPVVGACALPALFFPSGPGRMATVAVGISSLWIALSSTTSGYGGVRRGDYRSARFERGLREEVIASLAERLPEAFRAGATLGVAPEYNDTLFHLFRARPEYRFIPVAEEGVPRLLREGNLDAALVGQFRNEEGQGLTKFGVYLPRNSVVVRDPETFYRIHRDWFGVKVEPVADGLLVHLPLRLPKTWSGPWVLLHVASGLVRAIGDDAVLTIETRGAIDPSIRATAGGLPAPIQREGNRLSVPLHAPKSLDPPVWLDVLLERAPSDAQIALTGATLERGIPPNP
jgi:hypothetical protein